MRVAAVADRPATHALLETVADLLPRRGDGGRARGGRPPGARDRRRRPLRVPPRAGRRGGPRRPAARRGHRAAHPASPPRSRRDPSLLGDVAESTVAAELACHWKSAHQLERSLGAYVRAGVGAKRLYAYEVAQRHFERALGLWDRVPDAGGDHRDRPRRAAAAERDLRRRARRGLARRRAAARGARPASTTGADPLRAAGLYERVGNFLRVGGRRDESFAAFDRAVALLPPHPSVERARVLQTRAGSRCCSATCARRARPRPAPSRRRAPSATRGSRSRRSTRSGSRAPASARSRRASRRCAPRTARARRAGRPQPRRRQPLRGARPRRPHRGGAGARARRARDASASGRSARRSTRS